MRNGVALGSVSPPRGYEAVKAYYACLENGCVVDYSLGSIGTHEALF